MVDVHLHEIERMIWLGEQRGCLTDWLTQRWVIATGRKIFLTEYPWLEGPIGKTRRIGSDFFVNYARENDATIQPGDGILPSIDALRSESNDTKRIEPLVREFYEHTRNYDKSDSAQQMNFVLRFQPLHVIRRSKKSRFNTHC